MVMAKGKRGRGQPMGFKSKKQWRWAFATKQKFAHKWAHRTAGGPVARYRRLPTRVARPTLRTTTRRRR